ncbi:phage terminase large subunit [Acetobacteraceae bacterium H6797]|nr:phage terminase large subunit [Acetobacteraceae bacterium H6797]
MQETQAEFLEFLWIWNSRNRMETPAVHRRIARWLQSRHDNNERRLVLMAFRGCGKSTLIGLYCAWLLSRWPETRILVLAADHHLATKMVATVRRIIRLHPFCAHLLSQSPENWAADRFTVKREGALRDPSMLAAGLAGNITGARADVIICDDVEVAGNCDTPGKREELRERLKETEFILVPGGTTLYVGTPHTSESLYRPASQGENFLAGYKRLVVPVLTPSGRSAWPERFDLDTIRGMEARVGPTAFRRQMLLQAVSDQAARLDPAAIVEYAEETAYREANGRPVLELLGRRLASGSAFWDPAYGRPGTGDASVLACVYLDGEGNSFLHRLAYLTHDPNAPDDPATQQCRAVAVILRDAMMPVVRVETNGIGKFLPALLRRELARAGAACSVIEHVSTRAKNERILGALEPVLAARRLHVRAPIMRGPFPREMAEWSPTATRLRDDALDAVAGCLLAEAVRFPPTRPAPRGPGWRGG